MVSVVTKVYQLRNRKNKTYELVTERETNITEKEYYSMLWGYTNVYPLLGGTVSEFKQTTSKGYLVTELTVVNSTSTLKTVRTFNFDN